MWIDRLSICCKQSKLWNVARREDRHARAFRGGKRSIS
jgi:hypothetical protein